MDVLNEARKVLNKIDKRIITDIESRYIGIEETYNQYESGQYGSLSEETVYNLIKDDYNMLYDYINSILKIYENDTEEEDLEYVSKLKEYIAKLDDINDEFRITEEVI